MSCRQRQSTARDPVAASIPAATLLILQARTRWRKEPEFSGLTRVARDDASSNAGELASDI
jgi:hypothetical protein